MPRSYHVVPRAQYRATPYRRYPNAVNFARAAVNVARRFYNRVPVGSSAAVVSQGRSLVNRVSGYGGGGRSGGPVRKSERNTNSVARRVGTIGHSSHGQFAGGFGKARKVSHKAKKFNKKPSLAKATNQNNVVAVGSTPETNCLYINYSNLLRSSASAVVGQSIIRHLWYQMGVSIADFNQTPQQITATHTFEYLLYHRSAATGNASVTSAATSNNLATYATHAENMVNALVAISDTDVLQSVVLRVLQGTVVVELHRLYADTSSMHITQLHVTRMQNICGTVTDEDNRDQVSVVGKMYEGTGVYPVYQATDNTGYPFLMDPPVGGTVRVYGAGTNVQIQQAMPANAITNCQRVSHFKYENGDIKSHQMKYNRVVKMSDLPRFLAQETRTPAETNQKGMWRLFAFEKAIGIAGEIQIRSETDSFTSGWITGGRTPVAVMPQVTIA